MTRQARGVSVSDVTLAVGEHGGIRAAAKALGLDRRTVQRALRRASIPPVSPAGPLSVAGDEPLAELLARRTVAFERRASARREVVSVRVEETGPVGLLLFGDPHADDDGCDLPLLRQHVELCKEPGVYSVHVGDLANNWVGRLARLHAAQGVTARDAWRLVEWLVTETDPLILCAGNHDAWARHLGVSPLDWIAHRAGVPAYRETEIRAEIIGPGWAEPLRLWVRHAFPGSSMWSKSHGAARAAQTGGWPADILVAGHIHAWEGRTAERPDGSVYHALQLASYKRMDDYAAALGHPATHHGAACFVLVDPRADRQHRIAAFWDVAAGVDYLAHLRSRSQGER